MIWIWISIVSRQGPYWGITPTGCAVIAV